MAYEFDDVASRRMTRRTWLARNLSAVIGATLAPWFYPLAARAAADPARRRSCILLWMPGGPSQLDTFDPKPGHANGGSFAAIDTAVPGVRISEHLPGLASRAEQMAIIRSMSTKEGDHVRASHLVRTGYAPGGPVQYPTLASLVGNELYEPTMELPCCVSIGASPFGFAPAGYGPGFLGPRFAPLTVGAGRFVQANGQAESLDAQLRVPNLSLAGGVDQARAARRLELWRQSEVQFASSRPGANTASHLEAYERANRMMQGTTAECFDLSREADALRDAYGPTVFGQGCLLARRLVERGVPFVEVSLSGEATNQGIGWDTHRNNFEIVKSLSGVLDRGFSTLLDDLKSRGLLESTVIIWAGEFGRTPKINGNAGRDHFPQAWSTVLAGGAITGGQAIGRTSDDGMQVADRPVSVPDFLATVLLALGLDPQRQNMSNVGRPIRLADPSATPITECLA